MKEENKFDNDRYHFNHWTFATEMEIERQRKRISILIRKYRFSNNELPDQSRELKNYGVEFSKCSTAYETSYQLIKKIEKDLQSIKELVNEE